MTGIEGGAPQLPEPAAGDARGRGVLVSSLGAGSVLAAAGAALLIGGGNSANAAPSETHVFNGPDGITVTEDCGTLTADVAQNFKVASTAGNSEIWKAAGLGGSKGTPFEGSADGSFNVGVTDVAITSAQSAFTVTIRKPVVGSDIQYQQTVDFTSCENETTPPTSPATSPTDTNPATSPETNPATTPPDTNPATTPPETTPATTPPETTPVTSPVTTSPETSPVTTPVQHPSTTHSSPHGHGSSSHGTGTGINSTRPVPSGHTTTRASGETGDGQGANVLGAVLVALGGGAAAASGLALRSAGKHS